MVRFVGCPWIWARFGGGPSTPPLSFRFAIFRPRPPTPARARKSAKLQRCDDDEERGPEEKGRGEEMEALSFSRFGIEEADKKRSELLARLLCLGRAPGIPLRSSITEKNGYSKH